MLTKAAIGSNAISLHSILNNNLVMDPSKGIIKKSFVRNQ